MSYTLLLEELIKPLVNHPDEIKVTEQISSNKKEITLYAHANKADLSKLIGKQGMVANAIRQLVSTKAKLDHKKLMIHFESNE